MLEGMWVDVGLEVTRWFVVSWKFPGSLVNVPTIISPANSTGRVPRIMGAASSFVNLF